MKQRTIGLEWQVLALFRHAYGQGRSDIAEHLLRALELLDQRPGVEEAPSCRCALIEAYGELASR